MRPPKEELIKFDIKKSAEHFQVTEQTVRRWLKHYGIYHPKQNYGPKKITKNIVQEIRKLYGLDNYTQKKLGDKFGLTQAMIGRIINNTSHRIDIHFGANAGLQVGYKYD
jgi:hypothetical protein